MIGLPPGTRVYIACGVTDTLADGTRTLSFSQLLAHLATKFASEAGTPANLYGGPLSFERSGPEGVVWVLGHFENRPGSVRLEMRRSGSPATSRDPREQMSAPSFHELALVDPPQEGAANPSESYSDPRT